jgi:hypothetical protein
MAIYAIGAFYDGTTDVSDKFISNNIVGVGWGIDDAPELHQLLATLKVGDIVYIKACSFGASEITVKGIGLIKDEKILDSAATNGNAEVGRNVIWKCKNIFTIPNPSSNVRLENCS